MKFKTILLLFITVNFYAQDLQQDIITYKCSNTFWDKTLKNKRLKSPELVQSTKRLALMIKEASKLAKFELKYNKNGSLFKMQDALETENGYGFKMLNKGIFYIDHKGNVIKQIDAFGSLFLIENPISNKKWKLTNETKMIK